MKNQFDIPLDIRLATAFIPEPNSGCWLWLGRLGPDGYGKASFKNRPHQAHRLAYMTWKGPIPREAFICHTCDVKCCINPDHLYIGDLLTNACDAVNRKRYKTGNQHMRRIAPERWPSGSRHHKAKLTEEQVRGIRRDLAQGITQTAIAKRLGVDQTTISNIALWRTWREINP